MAFLRTRGALVTPVTYYYARCAPEITSVLAVRREGKNETPRRLAFGRALPVFGGLDRPEGLRLVDAVASDLDAEFVVRAYLDSQRSKRGPPVERLERARGVRGIEPPARRMRRLAPARGSTHDLRNLERVRGIEPPS